MAAAAVRFIPAVLCFYLRLIDVFTQPLNNNGNAGNVVSGGVSGPQERISMQKCREYGRSVFTRHKKRDGEGYIEQDSCIFTAFATNMGPFQARIGYGEKNHVEWLCAGSLISERFVLSAAACTDLGEKGPARWVSLENYNFPTNQQDGVVFYEISERINHPDYKSQSIYNDIALYKLKEVVTFDELVRPICLQANHSLNRPHVIESRCYNKEGKLSLFGVYNTTIVGAKQCEDAYKTSVGPSLTNGIVDATQLCAASLDEDVCRGGPGASLHTILNDPHCLHSQVGVRVSGHPGVYTRVSHYLPWIEPIVWP